MQGDGHRSLTLNQRLCFSVSASRSARPILTVSAGGCSCGESLAVVGDEDEALSGRPQLPSPHPVFHLSTGGSRPACGGEEEATTGLGE